MAVFKSLTFDNENSLDYGVYITGEAVYNAPARAMEMVSVPGRNGAFPLDQGRFENISVKYPAGAFGETQTEFASNIMKFRNVLASRYRYVRLSDDYNTDEFRLGMYRSGLETKPVSMSRAGEFDIIFDCKPQRFLVSGETPQSASDWSDVETETGSIVTIEADDTTAIKDLTADIEPIQDLHGYDAPWVGGAGKNKFPMPTTGVLTINGITVEPTDDGQIWVHGTPTSTSGYTQFNIQAKVPLEVVSQTITLSVNEKTVGVGFAIGSGNGSINLTMSDTVTSKTGEFTDGDRVVLVNVRNDIGANFNKKYKVQLEIGSTATAWTPYENICPISGHTDVVVVRTNENLAGDDGHYWQINTSGIVEDNYRYNAHIFKCEQGEKYTFGFDTSVARVFAYFYDYPQLGSKTYNGSRTVFTATS